jgi:hypothetical protein
MAAGMGKPDAFAQAGVQDALTFADVDGSAEGLNG